MVIVSLIKSSSIVDDPRIKKISKSLSKNYELIVLGWNRGGQPYDQNDNQALTTKLFGLRAPIGKISIVLYYPLFWSWLFIKLINFRPAVVHACNVDTIPPCFIYKVIFGKKLIFDVFDRYAMAYFKPKGIMYRLVNYIEEKYAKHSDMLITVWEKVLETFPNRPRICPIIVNCPEEIHTPKIARSSGQLKLVYTGNIVKHRGMEAITTAIRGLNGVEMHIAGRVIDKNLLDDLLKLDNVNYRGLLSMEEALHLESTADALVILYDPTILNHRISMPNKMFSAMMLGIPTITNLGAELIDTYHCGILVDYRNSNSIRSGIISIRDDKKLLENLGKNGRQAFLSKYNWANMEKQLLESYTYLLSN